MKTLQETYEAEKLESLSKQMIASIKTASADINTIESALAEFIVTCLNQIVKNWQAGISDKKTLQNVMSKKISNDIARSISLVRSTKMLLSAFQDFSELIKAQLTKLNIDSLDAKASIASNIANTANKSSINSKQLIADALKAFKTALKTTSFNINDIHEDDIEDISMNEISLIQEHLSKIDLTDFATTLKKIQIADTTSSASQISTNDKKIQDAARKISLMWQRTKDPNKFVSILIAAGLDPDKITDLKA